MDCPAIFASPVLQIVCISDTHNDDCRDSVPHGDIFIHAGDMTDNGTFEEFQKAYDWIASLPHKVKIVVAGKFCTRKETFGR
jgi:predicted phosphodiesterase